MGNDPAPAQASEVKKVELPAWVDAASQDNYNFAREVAGRPLEQYQGQQVANLPENILKAGQLLNSKIGSTDQYTSGAADIYNRTAGPMDITSYLNPYTAEVEKNAIDNANRSLQTNLNMNADQARKSAAFGGSRGAIQNAVTESETTRGIGDLGAKLRLQGFDTASANALADRTGMRSSAAGLLGVAGTTKASEAQDIMQLLGYGGLEQQNAQKNIDAAMKQFYEKRDYPTEQLNVRLAALGMSPYGKTETGSKTSTAEQLGPDWPTIGLGALKAFTMSDRNTKTDIKKLTDGPIPMYAYRYKGDPKSYPKVVGPMAQDIGKVHPEAVKKVGKHRVVDLENLMEVLS
jgi:hypothetical protein